nr:MAG TPA: hypothetical protein [Caudoviricetes sp.]
MSFMTLLHPKKRLPAVHRSLVPANQQSFRFLHG